MCLEKFKRQNYIKSLYSTRFTSSIQVEINALITQICLSDENLHNFCHPFSDECKININIFRILSNIHIVHKDALITSGRN